MTAGRYTHRFGLFLPLNSAASWANEPQRPLSVKWGYYLYVSYMVAVGLKWYVPGTENGRESKCSVLGFVYFCVHGDP